MHRCESLAKVRSGFDELRDYDGPTAHAMNNVAAPTTNGRQDKLAPGVAKLASGLVVRWEMTLSVSTDADPPGTSLVAPAVSAGWNERRVQIAGIELGCEQVDEGSNVDRRIG
jgi:hypothetical protein